MSHVRRSADEAEAEALPDDVHECTAGRAGANVPEDSLSGRVLSGGTRPTYRLDGGARPGQRAP